MIRTDPVNLLCDLIEARVGSFEANTLRSEAAQAVEFLSKIGALMPGQLTRIMHRELADVAQAGDLA